MKNARKKMMRPFLFVPLFLGAALVLAQTAPGSVEGTLKNGTTGEPIAGMTISLESPAADRTALTATTRADGSFVFESVPPRLYRVYVGRLDEIRPEQGGGPKAITVAPGQNVKNVQFVRMSPAVISGRVLDANGGPLAGASVEATAIVYRSGRAMFSTILGGSARTDDRGEYRISVPPDEYYIRVSVPRGTTSTSTTLFPGTVDISKAQLVSAKSGEETSRVDFSVAATDAAHRITGRAVVPSLFPPTIMVQVNLIPVDRPAGLISLGVSSIPVSSGSGKEFELQGVLPGIYDLFATASEPTPRPQGPLSTEALRAAIRPVPLAFGRVRISMPPQDLAGVIIPLDPGVPVSGRVVFSGEKPALSSQLYLSLETEELPVTMVPRIDGPVDDSGSFAVPPLPQARYSVKLHGLPEDSYIADIREGEESIFAEGLRVGKIPLRPLQLIVNARGAIVEGVVRSSDQKGVPFNSAILIPQKSLRWNLDLQKTVTTDGEGRFTFRGVAPGSYKVFAWEQSLAMLRDGTSELPDSFVSGFEESGSAVSVTEAGRVEGIQVPFIPRKR